MALQLIELSQEEIARHIERKTEERNAASLADLEAIGIRRGYANPSRWAQLMSFRRNTKRPCLSCGAKQDIDGNLPCGH